MQKKPGQYYLWWDNPAGVELGYRIIIAYCNRKHLNEYK